MKIKLDKLFYQRPDVTKVARDLLGKFLWTNFNNSITTGKIVEVEAYCGAIDKACHAYPDKRTDRTEIMYNEGGFAYVYLVYGMHHLFNIVTNMENLADAVLVRAIEPVEGIELMYKRRNVYRNNKLLTGGPARLTQAMGIDVSYNKTDLTGDTIWITNGVEINSDDIISTSRIGVEYAGEDAFLPWRYYINNNKYVSR